MIRSIFPRIPRLVRPGGFVLWTAFLEGAFRPFNPNKLLKEGELRGLFEGWGFDVLVDRMDRIEDGRPIQVFLARKRAS